MRQFSTVADALLNSIENRPDDMAIHVTGDDGVGHSVTYASLFTQACCAAGGYSSMGLKPGDRVIIALPASTSFYAAYLGAWFGGLIPVIINPPGAGKQQEKHARLLDMVIQKALASFVVLPDNVFLRNPALLSCSVTTLLTHSPISPDKINSDAIAHLQCTSGSTAAPRLVIVRHRNIAANVLGIGEMIRHRSTDKLVSWLPLSHDMGLIGISYSWGWQCPLIASTPSRFVRNPFSWLQMISDHKGTLSPAPNAAFAACTRLAAIRTPTDIDLSTWRVALCGSEPVQENTFLQFEQAFKRFGYKPETMLPVYGLAEATLAATMPDPDALPHVESVETTSLINGRINTVAATSSEKYQRVVALGTCIPDHSIRIVGEDGLILPAGNIGEIELNGPSVTEGYWMDETATNQIKRPDGYLRTGDLGFILNDQLYVTGRKKDTIIIGGRNFSPAFIEEVCLSSVAELNIKNLVAIGLPNRKTGTEMLHLMIETRQSPNEDEQLKAETGLRDRLLDHCGITGVMIHWMERDGVPYTTSGKVQRFLCKQIIQHQIDSIAGR